MATVRRGTYTDVLTIVEYMRVYHTTSNLKDIEFNTTSMVATINHHVTARDHCVFIAEDSGDICGVLLGSTDCFIFNEKAKWATDTLFVAKQGGKLLLDMFKQWAFDKKVDRIIMGNSSGNVKVDTFYQEEALELTGGMYVFHKEQV